ncbi:PREDICTED: uncharacterized protein LOC105512583 [Colobus angolensis palliatus]|uniref:uncharacterized protein LOC105512583 n=1 Tax=Colobus angolensis palliatus TaxID=336983 RepID=UPI0005F36A47|nr:PREDICTED: uncharacterized protein LOC105512583 [Colobus angolensis palliatus]
MAGDNDRDPVKIQAIPRAVALTRANLEGLTWAETVHTRYHHCPQLSQNQTLPAVKMAAATAAVGSAYAGGDQAEEVASERVDAKDSRPDDAHAQSRPTWNRPVTGAPDGINCCEREY